MKKRKIPMRKSVVSGEMKPKKELVRITRSKEGEVALDPTGKLPGRGAYVDLDPAEVQKAWDLPAPGPWIFTLLYRNFRPYFRY